VGLRRANLTFTDDATGSPRSIPLSGTATPIAPIVCLSTNGALIFSNQLVGASSAAQSITITNCGSMDLNVSDVSLVGSAAGDFSKVENCTTGSPIPPGGTCALNVTFTPTAAGNRQASLVITHDAAGSPTTVTVRGVGTVPAAAVCLSSSSINFGSVGVGGTSSPPQSLIITNCGTANLVVGGIAITGANAGDFTNLSSTCGTVLVGGTCTVNLQFAPSGGGTRSATLAISNNAAGSPQLVSLIGSGSLSQPDAAIGKSTKLKKMAGFGTNNTTGVKQEIKQNVRRRARHGPKYYVAVKNVGSGSDRFTLQGQQIAGGPGFAINYFLGAKTSESVDVTAAVDAGTFATTTMASGAVTGDATMIRVEVTVPDKTVVFKGTTATFTLTFTSAGDPSKQDTVRITAVAK
jgi:hypothetical protein